MIVGEAPGKTEEGKTPFIGTSGQELDKMLHEAGIARTECFLTNVARYRPTNNDIGHFFIDGFTKGGGPGTRRNPGPEIREGLLELAEEIREVKPNVIIAFGNTPLWALTNSASAKSGIGNWRGSELPLAERLPTIEHPIGHRAVVIPTYHPAAVLRKWDWRALVVHDLRARVRKYIDQPEIVAPPYSFIIRPTFDDVTFALDNLHMRADLGPMRLAVDIETRLSHIACIGLGWSKYDAICIPLMCIERQLGYWSPQEEAAIIMRLHELLTHPNIQVVGQNFLYDAQYFGYRLGFIPRVHDDTYYMQQTAWPGLQRSLAFMSSMYADYHVFWKDEGKDFGAVKTAAHQDQGWAYNCKDCVITYEISEVLDEALKKMKLYDRYRFEMELWHHLLEMMLRGVAIDKKTKASLAQTLFEEIDKRGVEIGAICGHPLNVNSPKQMQTFFYGDLGMPVQRAKKKNKYGVYPVTLDESALLTLARKEPLLRPLIERIAEKRVLNTFYSTFVMARLGEDQRMRSYYGRAETFRLTSSEDAFGSGANLQNLPRGLEDEVIELDELVHYNLPNIRKLYIPDSGFTIAEVDLSGADAQVVARDADCKLMQQIFAERKKIWVESGRMMYGAAFMGPDGKREPYYTRVKSGGHATDYGAKPRALSLALALTMHEAERFQKRWLEIYPEIKQWHKRVEMDLQTKRSVTNRFGYRRYYFDRIDDLLPEALAWIGQSTVACVANLGLVHTGPAHTNYSWGIQYLNPSIETLRIRLKELGFQKLLQVHDSVVFQYPTRNEAAILPLLHQALSVTVPYDNPLVIPWGLKTSTKSWGDAKDKEWPVAISIPLSKTAA